jgi:hypothetical protein
MKIGVCTLAIGDDYRKSLYYCIRDLDKYCEKHGYELTREIESYDNREPMWNKIKLLEKKIKDYDYLVWIDADIQIHDMEKPLEFFISNYMGSNDIMLATDCGNEYNTGMWFFTCSDYSKKILSLIYHFPTLAGKFHEQGVFKQLYDKNIFKLQNRCFILPEVDQRLFNPSFFTFQTGDFCLHYMGIKIPSTLSFATRKHYPRKLDNEGDEEYKNRMICDKEIRDNLVAKYGSRYINSTPKVKIGICTFYTGEKYSEDVVLYPLKIFQEYCTKYNYDFIVETKSLDESLPPQWTKILLLLKHLSKFDYLVWMDIDIIIMNDKITLNQIIYDHMDGKDFLLSRDVSNHINTGVLFVKNTQYAKDILELNYKLPELRYRGCEDQDVFTYLYDNNILDIHNHCTILSSNQQHIFNCCVGYYYKDVFLIHFISLGKDGLLTAFNDFYPKRKPEEDLNVYESRMNWFNNSYK